MRKSSDPEEPFCPEDKTELIWWGFDHGDGGESLYHCPTCKKLWFNGDLDPVLEHPVDLERYDEWQESLKYAAPC